LDQCFHFIKLFWSRNLIDFCGMGGGCDGPAKAKVSWNSVCMPKDEGGLGVRRMD
jgi:hypothetical protein